MGGGWVNGWGPAQRCAEQCCHRVCDGVLAADQADPPGPRPRSLCPPVCLQFSRAGTARFVASVGSSVLPAARAQTYIRSGISSVLVLQGVLLPVGLKPVPLPAPPPPPPRSSPPRPKKQPGGGSIGGGNPAVNYYLGCFADGPFGASALPTLLFTGASNLTRLACAQAASASDLPFFGMRGNVCRGGSNLALAQSQGVSAGCTTQCSGDASQLCGGATATTMYSFEKLSPPTPTCSEDACYLFLGCFVEPWCTGGPRGLPNQVDLPSITIATCAASAKANNYLYFALQDGEECFASNSTAYALSKGVSNECTKQCGDEGGTLCGGPCANSIYQVSGKVGGGRGGGRGRRGPASIVTSTIPCSACSPQCGLINYSA